MGLGNSWRAQYELVAWYQKGQPHDASNRWGNVRRHARVRGYPTEKPLSLLAELIVQSSVAGATVLDPFCGSGNVGAAASRLGRRAVLIDVDVKAAERRLRVGALRRATAT